MNAGRYRPIAADAQGALESKVLGLKLDLEDNLLRLFDIATGQRLLRPAEEKAARITAEEARTAAEEARIMAEEARITAVKARTVAEEARITAEKARTTAEEAQLSADAENRKLRAEIERLKKARH